MARRDSDMFLKLGSERNPTVIETCRDDRSFRTSLRNVESFSGVSFLLLFALLYDCEMCIPRERRMSGLAIYPPVFFLLFDFTARSHAHFPTVVVLFRSNVVAHITRSLDRVSLVASVGIQVSQPYTLYFLVVCWRRDCEGYTHSAMGGWDGNAVRRTC
jgi:hypothetical protein